MYHRLAMHIHQPPSDVFELSKRVSVTGAVDSGSETYKLKPIHIPIRLDELVDIPIYHPF
jgi:hypothetical protein